MEFHENSQLASQNSNEDIHLGQFILSLAKQWKIIFLITAAGTLLAGALVSSMPNIYKASAIIAIPTEDAIEHINKVGFIRVDQKKLFRLYYDTLRSESKLSEFILENGYLRKLSPDLKEGSESIALAKLMSSFNTQVLEPEPERPKQKYVEFPTRVAIDIEHRNEPVVVELLSKYLNSTNFQLIDNLEAQSTAIGKTRQADIEREIALLREAARYKRKLEIERLEKQNQISLKRLENERALLLELAGKNRQSQLIRIDEALVIAEKLGIKDPTPIDEFSASNSQASTSIKVGSQQELPLYLMGTRYLSALAATLKSRNDEKFLTNLNEIEKQIAEIKLDPELKALKTRESDDPYINELPTLVNQMKELKSKSSMFESIKLFTLDKAPSITGKSIRPKKLLMIASSFIASLFLATMLAALRASMKRRT